MHCFHHVSDKGGVSIVQTVTCGIQISDQPLNLVCIVSKLDRTKILDQRNTTVLVSKRSGEGWVSGFNPNKDSFTFSNQLTTSVSYHDDSHGNAVVTVDNAGDTITLLGVHSADLHPSDFHFVDPAALPAAPSVAQMVADLHAHGTLV